MPLTPWTSVRVGLGLWNSPPGTVLVEAGLFVVGVVLCFQATRARDRIGSWGLYGFLALLAVVYLAALAGPPPPTVTALGWASLALPALLLPFAAWVDRHRRPA